MPAPLTYLTMDSVQGGVGASQVLPYVQRLAAGRPVELHSFEPFPVLTGEGDRRRHPSPVSSVGGALGAGIRWHPHRFGPGGRAAGAGRVGVGVAALRGAGLVHARSDLAAASALVARPAAWVWDVRSFWVDQRIALGMVRRGSRTERVLRSIERGAARRATAITTLTQAAIHELGRRHGNRVADKACVVTTCVDLDRFGSSPFPDGPPALLLSGSYNALYDLGTMLRLAAALRRRGPIELTLLRPAPTPWDAAVEAAGGRIGSSTFADMPGHVAAAHAGLSVCHTDDPQALVAAMPTKIGELLASGRPVVVNAGLGDCDRLLPGAGAGVVLRGTGDPDVERGADELLDLLADPGTPARCRALAEAHFSLDIAVATLEDIYRRIA